MTAQIDFLQEKLGVLGFNPKNIGQILSDLALYLDQYKISLLGITDIQDSGNETYLIVTDLSCLSITIGSDFRVKINRILEMKIA